MPRGFACELQTDKPAHCNQDLPLKSVKARACEKMEPLPRREANRRAANLRAFAYSRTQLLPDVASGTGDGGIPGGRWPLILYL